MDSYSNLAPAKPASASEEFAVALASFLSQHPDLGRNARKLEMLQYCFKFYINFDPQFRDLPALEKLEQARRMAEDFFGTMSNARP